jgi:type II secretory pathway pseudopilin PulG
VTHKLGRRTPTGDDGVSLVELLVSMGLLSVLLGVLLTAVVTAVNSNGGVNARSQNASIALTAANRMSKALREGITLSEDFSSPFSAASTTSVTFTSDLSSIANNAAAISTGPTTVTFSLGTNLTSCPSPDYCLFETDTPTVLSKDAEGNTAWVPGHSGSVTRLLVHAVSSSASLFSYFQTASSDPTCNSATPTLTTTAIGLTNGSVPAANLDDISMVEIDVPVAAQSNLTVPATDVETRVYLPNTSPCSAATAETS